MSIRIGGLVLVAVAALAAVGCGSDDPAGSATSAPANTTAATSVGGDDELPDREPEVTGVVAAGVGDAQPTRFLAEPSDAYYEGMALAGSDGEPLVVGPDGDVLSVTDLNDGDEIAVWIEGGCAESYPVQCDVTAIRVTQPAS
jgi:hypothetical protein